VGTERIGEYLVDIGADNFLTNKPWAIGLCRRLGIEDRLIQTDARYRGALVLCDGRPVPVPEGFQLMSPTAIWPMLTTPLLSVWGKLRLLMEWFVPRKQVDVIGAPGPGQSVVSAQKDGLIDESVADFVRRRFGREALNRLIQPLVGGIYTSDPEKLSLAATMPRFLEMERDYGSLIRASLSQKAGRKGGNTVASHSAEQTDSSSGARYGLFAGLKGGLEDLVDALRKSVCATCSVRLNTAISSIESGTFEPSQGPVGSRYRLMLTDGSHEDVSAVIVATSGARTGQVVRSLDAQLSAELNAIEYASSALVVTGHRLADVRDPLNAFGLVIPHAERRRILAVSFSSRKFPNRAPADRVLLRTFVGGALQPELFQLTDEEMVDTVLSELREILGVHGEPDFVKIYRYAHAMPQYLVGHLDRVARIEELVQKHPGLALAGIAYRGVGVPDVIGSGERAAEIVFNG
jgi:protoporphyrinogen/coproporphyrinogen III oxidase